MEDESVRGWDIIVAYKAFVGYTRNKLLVLSIIHKATQVLMRLLLESTIETSTVWHQLLARIADRDESESLCEQFCFVIRSEYN